MIKEDRQYRKPPNTGSVPCTNMQLAHSDSAKSSKNQKIITVEDWKIDNEGNAVENGFKISFSNKVDKELKDLLSEVIIKYGVKREPHNVERTKNGDFKLVLGNEKQCKGLKNVMARVVNAYNHAYKNEEGFKQNTLIKPKNIVKVGKKNIEEKSLLPDDINKEIEEMYRTKD